MTALSITASQVVWVGGVTPRRVTFGEAVTPGQGVYKDTADNEHKLADASGLATAILDGITLSDGYNARLGLIAPPGAIINVGATTVAGTLYVVSATAGGIVPITDLMAGEFPVAAFWGTGTAQVTVLGYAAGVAIPA